MRQRIIVRADKFNIFLPTTEDIAAILTGTKKPPIKRGGLYRRLFKLTYRFAKHSFDLVFLIKLIEPDQFPVISEMHVKHVVKRLVCRETMF